LPAHFPPTLVYDEGWLLRLVLDSLDRFPVPEQTLAPTAGATWYSEALLPSPFEARRRGDSLAESRTHADAAIGHILVGAGGKADVSLRDGATQLIVVEAKLFSPLSAGTKNAPGYGQAARTIACMVELCHLVGRAPGAVDALSFVVAAPSAQIETGKFAGLLEKETIRRAVVARGRVRGRTGRLARAVVRALPGADDDRGAVVGGAAGRPHARRAEESRLPRGVLWPVYRVQRSGSEQCQGVRAECYL
jgi:hypothetical protein